MYKALAVAIAAMFLFGVIGCASAKPQPSLEMLKVEAPEKGQEDTPITVGGLSDKAEVIAFTDTSSKFRGVPAVALTVKNGTINFPKVLKETDRVHICAREGYKTGGFLGIGADKKYVYIDIPDGGKQSGWEGVAILEQAEGEGNCICLAPSVYEEGSELWKAHVLDHIEGLLPRLKELEKQAADAEKAAKKKGKKAPSST